MIALFQTAESYITLTAVMKLLGGQLEDKIVDIDGYAISVEFYPSGDMALLSKILWHCGISCKYKCP